MDRRYGKIGESTETFYIILTTSKFAIISKSKVKKTKIIFPYATGKNTPYIWKYIPSYEKKVHNNFVKKKCIFPFNRIPLLTWALEFVQVHLANK